MTPKALEKFAMSLPGTTRVVQWGGNHVFKVGGKMFAIIGPPENRMRGLLFKAGEASYAILTKQKGIEPAPYLARAKWVRLEKLSALTDKELKAYVTRAHAMIAAALPKKTRASLGIAEANPFL
jgi:predicted DNA-binding protein (MmcQ/YjbR family)